MRLHDPRSGVGPEASRAMKERSVSQSVNWFDFRISSLQSKVKKGRESCRRKRHKMEFDTYSTEDESNHNPPPRISSLELVSRLGSHIVSDKC